MFHFSFLIFSFFSIHFFLIFSPSFLFRSFHSFLIWTFLLTLLLLFNHPFLDSFFFSAILHIDSFSLFLSSFLTFFFILFLFLIPSSFSSFKELPLLFLIISFGFFSFLISNDLILLYLSLELFSLSFYLITSIHQNYFSTEAAIKYFIFNFLASAFFLLGSSFLFFDFSSLNFLHLTLFSPFRPSFGWFFLLISFFFKLSIAPFHFWTPDVFQGVLFPITAFFSLFPKFLLSSFLFRFYLSFFSSFPFFHSLFFFSAFLSLFFGLFGAFSQSNVKRFFAFSTIFNSGFFLLLISFSSPLSSRIFFFFLFSYFLANLSLFTFLTFFNLSHLFAFKSLSHSSFLSRFLFSIPILSLAGLPPFLGFLPKFFTLFLLFGSSLFFFLPLFLFFFFILSLFYYLRFLHFSFFSSSPFPSSPLFFSPSPSLSQSYLLLSLNFFLLFFSFNPSFPFLLSSLFSSFL